MKKIFLLLGFSVFAGTALFAQTATPPTPPTGPVAKPAFAPSVVKFNEVLFDFGQVEYNSDIRHTFEFKNISEAPVAVRDVGTSCGCTTPSYSKEPVAPGKMGSVTAKYDSSRLGAFNKTLTVYINDESIRLTIRGTVLAPKSENTQQKAK